jgi:hypothetical protein
MEKLKIRTLKDLADDVRNIPYIDSDNMDSYINKLANDIENYVPVFVPQYGTDLEIVGRLLNQLDQLSVHVKVIFNGHVLDSFCHNNVDRVFKEVLGVSKKDYDKVVKAKREEIRRENDEFQKRVPEIINDYIERGHKILDEKYHKLWDECVPVRVNDIYHGLECNACLDLIQMLNNGDDFDDVNEVFNNQDHSGLSHAMVCSMLVQLCDRGSDFIKHVGDK